MLKQLISRRSFLSAPFFFPIAVRAFAADSRRQIFQYDHVLGTSLDLAVWTSDPTAAEPIRDAVLQEVHRLRSILSTRDPDSEINRQHQSNLPASADLVGVLQAYELWERRTSGILSIHPAGPGSPRNVDALGKAYILDKAARAARNSARGVDGILLNIGGDMVTWGAAVEVSVADPAAPYDNAPPRTRIVVQNCAVATSGSYARGAHLLDGRSGAAVASNAAATVIAPDAVTANAIATTMCIAGEDTGFSILNRIRNSEALYVTGHRERRTAGFQALERPLVRPVSAAANWPTGYQLTLSLTLTEGATGRFGGRGGFGGGRGGRGGRGGERPYVAVWIENSAGKIVRVLAFWASKPRYFSELSRFWTAAGRDQNLVYSVARATRSPGKYDLVWDGFDEKKNPVPTGTYRVIVETNQEHGSYAKQESTISCVDSPATISLSATTNFEAVPVQYGPKPNAA